MSKPAWSAIKISLLLLFIVGVVSLVRYTPLGETVSIQAIRSNLEELPPAVSRLAYIGAYILGTVLLLPATLMSFVGAVLFGVLEGTLYTWIGATIGALLAFLLAKALGRDFVESLLGGRFAALDRRLRDHGFTGLLIVRLVPLFPFNGVNFGSGLTSIRFSDYALATAVGILPGTFVYQFLFDRFGTKILDEGFDWTDLLDPLLGAAVGLFVVFILAGKMLANRLARHKSFLDRDG